VIVPVFNPGPTLDDLVGSFDRQTLSAADFEVLLCDDGSDESTQKRLAAVAQDRPNVRVLNLPHSGWPGTPRNEGIAAAAGEYVFFVDQDDYLFDAALEKICDYADLHSSDVIVGKEVGIGRSLPRQIFRRDVPHAVLGKDFRLTEQRGRLQGWPEEWPGAVNARSPAPAWALATVHPSAVLRSRERDADFDALVADLSVAAEALAGREA
jgi:glycosyltransferase involved in cell wall biosynthesis